MNMVSSFDSAESFNLTASREGWPAFCDPGLEFASPELSDVLVIWERFAQDGRVPSRSQFSPRVLKRFLRNVAIYEHVQVGRDDRRYRVRLVGSSMVEVVGNIAGKYLDEAIPASFLPWWYASLDATLGARRPLRFLTRSDTNHREFLVGEYFSAPMAAVDGSASMVLGCSNYDGRDPWSIIEQKRALQRGPIESTSF